MLVYQRDDEDEVDEGWRANEDWSMGGALENLVTPVRC